MEPDWKKPLSLPELPAEEVLSAFLKYMHWEDEDIVKRRLNMSGKSTDDIEISSNKKYVKQRAEDIRGKVKESRVFPTEEQLHKTLYADALKSRQETLKFLTRQGKKPEDPKKEAQEVCATLFQKYSDNALLSGGAPVKKDASTLLGTIGFMRVLRDAGMLDNKFGFVEANAWWEAAAGRIYEEKDLPFETDWLVDQKMFAWIIQKLAKFKYPTAPTKEDALQCLVSMYLAPLAVLHVTALSFDKMLSHQAMRQWAAHDALLKRLYAHYSSLDLIAAHMVSWKAVCAKNAPLNMDHYVTLMNNFEVFPSLLTKRQLVDIARAVEKLSETPPPPPPQAPPSAMISGGGGYSAGMGMYLPGLPQTPRTPGSTVKVPNEAGHPEKAYTMVADPTPASIKMPRARYPVPAETVDPRDQPGIAGKTWTPNTPSSHVERFSEEVFAKDKKGRADPDHAEVAKGKGREVRFGRNSAYPSTPTASLQSEPGGVQEKKPAATGNYLVGSMPEKILYPAFQECLARSALLTMQQLPDRLNDADTTNSELTAYRIFLHFLPAAMRSLFEVVLLRRGYVPVDINETHQRLARKTEAFASTAVKILERNTARFNASEMQYKVAILRLRDQSHRRHHVRRVQHKSLLDMSGYYEVRGMQSPFRASLPFIHFTPAEAEKAAVHDLSEFDNTLHKIAWARQYDEMKRWEKPSKSSTFLRPESKPDSSLRMSM